MRGSIKTKIIFSTILVVAVSLSAAAFFIYSYVTAIIKEQSINENAIKLNQVTQQLTKIQEQIKKTTAYIITDEKINKLSNEPYRGELERGLNVRYDMELEIKRYVALNDNIVDIILARSDGEIFSNNRIYESYYREKLGERWFTDFQTQGLNGGFSAVHDTFVSSTRTEKVISYITNYTSLEDHSPYTFVLIINVNHGVLEDILRKSVSDFEQLLLLNKENGLIGSSGFAEDVQRLQLDPKFMEVGGYTEDKNKIVIVNRLQYDDWKQIAIISKDKLFRKINLMLVYFVVIVGVSFLFVLLVMIPIILNITRPISKLVMAMKRVSRGNLETTVVINSGDELELMGEGFNKMIGDIKEHMRNSILNERTKRQMQLDLLISQINPHFIYNTLNTIIYLTNAGRDRDVVHITDSFIRILQDTIRTGEAAIFATVKEEVDILRNYLAIQKYRYPGLFEVEFKLSEDVLTAKILRMAMQPIVENALFHGIHPAERQGLLRIEAARELDWIVLTIEDNGVGMERSMIGRVLEGSLRSRTSQQTRGIGVRNIVERLEYLYGAGDYEFQMTSILGQGTKTQIRIKSQPDC